MTEDRKARPDRQTPERRPRSMWWLVAKEEPLRTEMLTVDCGGEQALPVFSGEGEAEMFVWLGGAFEDGWHIRETSIGELVSILCGPCARVRSVALDPSPGMTAAEMIGLVSMSPARFVHRIATLGRRTPGHALR